MPVITEEINSEHIALQNEGINTPKARQMSFVEVFILVLIAIAFDVVSLVPFLNIFVGFAGLCLFPFYFIMKKMRGAYVFAGSLVKLIPFISMLPLFTITVFFTIFLTKANLKKTHSTQSS